MQKDITAQVSILLSILVLILIFGFSIFTPDPVEAQAVPAYGAHQIYFGSYSGVTSTVAEELLAAPGANYRWVVIGVNRETLVAEASKAIQICDHSGSTPAGATTGATSVAICEFAPTTAGVPGYHNFDAGIACAVNSAVMIEGVSTSTADVWVMVTAYKERVD